MLSVQALDAVAQGQEMRTVLQETHKFYISKCRVMTRILNDILDIREDALEIDANGKAMEHLGLGRGVFILKLPIKQDYAKKLFAAISIDTSLPRKQGLAAEIAFDIANITNPDNPAQYARTVCAQTYQNYKSALKWWHEHHDEGKNKVGCAWPADVEQVINKQIRAYKRDIGVKKRKGIMPQKEGKSAYNVTGYVAICNYFNQIRPCGHNFTWMEGIFSQLFTKLSINTIGRSDNIDDLLLSNIGWENDALTIKFGNTKSDIEGETTSEIKRLYANPFMPNICVVLAIAIYTWCKYRKPDDLHMFDGGDQHKRYYKELMRAVKEIPAHIDIGCNRSDVGNTIKFVLVLCVNFKEILYILYYHNYNKNIIVL